jgi:hypothetical protein
MKSYKEYLMESKKTYDFKIKIAGDCPKDCAAKIKEALASFKVESCSNGKTTPITEKQIDFPQLENVGVTIFDVCLSYPTTSIQVREAVANKLNMVPANIRVRNDHEEEELALNHEHDELSGEALLEKDLEEVDGQDLVGGRHVMSMLKELSKNRKTLEQYKGVNEKILAKKAPSEKADKTKTVQNNKSPVGSRKVTLPTVGGR